MKINPEKLTVENIQHIIEMCLSEFEYYNDMYEFANDKYHAGCSNAYANILDAFEARGIIEEDSENEQPK